MSGRLIILPKKSYTPWNAQNLERVMKDERLHYEKVQKEEEIKRKQSNVERIKLMKKRKKLQEETGEPNPKLKSPRTGSSNSGIHLVEDGNEVDILLIGDNDDSAASCTHTHSAHISKQATFDTSITEASDEAEKQNFKHVNLFEAEEKKMIESKISGIKTEATTSSTNQKQIGIMPVFLTRDRESHMKNKKSSSSSAESGSSSRPFYERDDCLKKNVDDKLKSRLDPMSQFQKHTNRNKDETNNNKNEHDELTEAENKKKGKKKHEKKRRRKNDQEENLDDSSSSQKSSSSSSKLFEKKRKKKSSRKHDKKKKRRRTSKEESKRRKSKGAESSVSKDDSSSDTMMKLLERKRQREQKEMERENDIRNKVASSSF